MSDEKILLTVPEVAALTGFSEGTLRHWISARRIPFVRVSSRCVRFQKGAILKWIEEMSISPKREHEKTLRIR